MKIGLLSDTHSFLHPKVFEHFQECQEIWHAGDIGSMEVLDQLMALNQRALSMETLTTTSFEIAVQNTNASNARG